MANLEGLSPVDAWETHGQYRLVPDPTTGEKREYQRVSSFARTLNTPGCDGLMAWHARNVLVGAVTDEGKPLVAAATQPTGYKSTLDRLAQLGGGGKAAKTGTDRHLIIAAALKGHDMTQLPAQAQEEIRAIVALIHELGTVEAVEGNTVCDELEVAGSFDYLIRGHDGTPIIGDLKTGKRKDDSLLEWGLQTYCHARGQHWRDRRRAGPVADRRPRLVVIHAPQTGEPPALIELDVDEAKNNAALAVQVRAARRAAKPKKGSKA